MYVSGSQTLRIVSVTVPPRIRAFAQTVLALGDRELAEQTSTSPDQEGPQYVADMRSTCRWIVAASAPHLTESVEQPGRRCTEFAWVPSVGWQQVHAGSCADSNIASTLGRRQRVMDP